MRAQFLASSRRGNRHEFGQHWREVGVRSNSQAEQTSGRGRHLVTGGADEERCHVEALAASLGFCNPTHCSLSEITRAFVLKLRDRHRFVESLRPFDESRRATLYHEQAASPVARYTRGG
jgi:hypothetical protein